ncbi:MAG: DUF1571 domain-containing protein [Thermoguttaceae bacterium]
MHRRCRSAAGLLALAFVSALPAAAAAESPDQSLLAVVIREAEQRERVFTSQVADYTCTLVKRERINGQLQGYEYADVKIRHRQVRNGQSVVPFSVYLKFLAPAEVQGREVLYVEGHNNGKLIARRGGTRFAYVTTALDPFSDLAMERNRYPITHIGILSLIDELLVVGREELQNPADELLCKQIDGVKVDNRPCRMVQFAHPVRREGYRYHVARIYVDQELQVPIRHEAYDWPDEEGGTPKLLEEYTYLNVKLNVDLTDWDFDHRNAEYDFLKDFQP